MRAYRPASRRLIVLGLLGTLIEFDAFKDMQPIADAVWKDLLAIAPPRARTVVVVSGRERALVSQCLGDLPLWIAAENGCTTASAGAPAAWTCARASTTRGSRSIKPVFKYFEDRTPGTR